MIETWFEQKLAPVCTYVNILLLENGYCRFIIECLITGAAAQHGCCCVVINNIQNKMHFLFFIHLLLITFKYKKKMLANVLAVFNTKMFSFAQIKDEVV